MLRKRLNSFKFAFKGLAGIWKEANTKIHLFATVCVIAAGYVLEIDKNDWFWIIICISSVLAAEGFNTAIERLTDLVSPDYHPLAGQTKDIAAAAVLITSIGASIIGLSIFVPALFTFFDI